MITFGTRIGAEAGTDAYLGSISATPGPADQRGQNCAGRRGVGVRGTSRPAPQLPMDSNRGGSQRSERLLRPHRSLRPLDRARSGCAGIPGWVRVPTAPDRGPSSPRDAAGRASGDSRYGRRRRPLRARRRQGTDRPARPTLPHSWVCSGHRRGVDTAFELSARVGVVGEKSGWRFAEEVGHASILPGRCVPTVC